MTTSDIVLYLLFLALVPIVGYWTVKLGTYANLRARDLYYRQHPQPGQKIHEEEEQRTP